MYCWCTVIWIFADNLPEGIEVEPDTDAIPFSSESKKRSTCGIVE
jgi:hypothetical protein